MPSSIIIKASDNIGTFLASTSSLEPGYGRTQDDANHQITLTFNSNNTNPVVSLARDPATGDYLENSLMLEINWVSNRRQVAFVVHDDAYGCEWTINGQKLTLSRPSVQVTNGSTIYAKSLRNAGSVPTQTATKVRIRGYWQTNTSPESNTGCYNKPSIIQIGTEYLIDWHAPDLSSYSASQKPKILGYMIIYWKGDWGASDGVTGIGSIRMVDGDTTSYVSNADWWSGCEGHHLKHTVFTIYDKGISPKISQVITECTSERPTNHAGTGNGNSVKNYSNYSKIDSNDTTQLCKTSFYLEDGTTYVKIGDENYSSYQVSGSKVVPPSGSSWIPTGYKLDGWYQKTGSGSWGSTLLTNAQVSNITIGTQDLSFKAKLSLIEYTVTWKNYDGSVLKTETVTYGTVPSYSGTTPTKTEAGYNNTFSGWSPQPRSASANISYTAQFTRSIITYNIIYVLNNDNVENNNPSTYTIESNTIYLNEPYCPNYIFLGWYPNAVIPAGSTGDKVFTAEWKYAYKHIWISTGSQWERGIPWVFDGQEWRKAKSVYLLDEEWKEASY